MTLTPVPILRQTVLPHIMASGILYRLWPRKRAAQKSTGGLAILCVRNGLL